MKQVCREVQYLAGRPAALAMSKVILPEGDEPEHQRLQQRTYRGLPVEEWRRLALLVDMGSLPLLLMTIVFFIGGKHKKKQT
jgi:hypothetical protein